mmetsp:Transcript_35019/g.76776  ORF Transcript_35019/g.76776 Transcript_35019/m.76776 type:complete len:316 (-) Transcript_35019:1559-2506(-)
MSSLDLPLHQTIVASTAAGVTSTLIGHPIDTLKVHLQTNPAVQVQSSTKTCASTSRFATIRAARHLLQTSGYSPLVFFRGIGPPVCNACLLNIVTFACFSQVKELVASNSNEGDSWLGSLTAGIVSGFVSAYLSTPTDYVKIQAQLRGVSSAAVLKEIFALRNTSVIKSTSILFRGHVPNLGREGVFTMVYLGIYDYTMSSSNNRSDMNGYTQESGTRSAIIKVAAISSFTGGLAWIVSYPFDTVKTVMQGAAPSMTRVSIPEAIQRIYNGPGGGYSAFYRGCVASTGRAILVTSSRMITYDWVAKTFSACDTEV